MACSHTSRASLPIRLYSAGLIFAAVQLAPELFVLRGLPLGGFDKHAVVMALDLIEGVTHGIEKFVVRADDRAVHRG